MNDGLSVQIMGFHDEVAGGLYISRGGRGPYVSRQPEHPLGQVPIQGLPARVGRAHRESAGVSLHPRIRQQAEHDRMRVQRTFQALPRWPHLGDEQALRREREMASYVRGRTQARATGNWRFPQTMQGAGSGMVVRNQPQPQGCSSRSTARCEGPAVRAPIPQPSNRSGIRPPPPLPGFRSLPDRAKPS